MQKSNYEEFNRVYTSVSKICVIKSVGNGMGDVCITHARTEVDNQRDH